LRNVSEKIVFHRSTVTDTGLQIMFVGREGRENVKILIQTVLINVVEFTLLCLYLTGMFSTFHKVEDASKELGNQT